MGSPLIDFYKDKTVFVTGGTGFVGTALIEKLLYSCKDLKRVYLLTKPRYGKSIEERMVHWLGSEAFERLRTDNPDALQKIKPMQGNIQDENFGLSDSDLKTLQTEVNIVFHVAANIHFDMSLAEAVGINTMATEEIIKICKGMKQMQALVYVSTAYSNCNRSVIHEKVYSTDMPLNVAYYAVNNCTNKRMLDILIEGRPNTYSYSKMLSEQLFASAFKELPITIVRPSVITSSVHEPCPGWLKGWSGVNLLAVYLSTNTLRCWIGDKGKVLDLVPVDMSVNMIIASAWDVAREWKVNKEEIKVFNYCSALQNPVTHGQYNDTCKQYLTRQSIFPFNLPPLVIENRTLYLIVHFLIQTIPDTILTALCWIFGQNSFLSKLLPNKRFLDVIKHLEFFSENEFMFIDYNVRELYNKMDARDQEIFDFNIRNVNWDSYLTVYAEGLEKHVLGRQK